MRYWRSFGVYSSGRLAMLALPPSFPTAVARIFVLIRKVAAMQAQLEDDLSRRICAILFIEKYFIYFIMHVIPS